MSGHKALAGLLERLAGATRRFETGEDPQAVAEELWPDFRAASLAVNLDIAAEHAEGLRRWQDVRHQP